MDDARETLSAFAAERSAESSEPAEAGAATVNADTRYRVLLDVARGCENVTLLDFGCGASELYTFMLRNQMDGITYHGMDLSSPGLEASRGKYPNVSYTAVDPNDPLAPPIPPFDYVVISKAFVWRRAEDASSERMKDLLLRLFDWAREGFAFSVAWKPTASSPMPLGALFDFVSGELSPNVSIRRDYGCPECTVYVYRAANTATDSAAVPAVSASQSVGDGAINPMIREGRPVFEGGDSAWKVQVDLGRLVADARSRTDVPEELKEDLEEYRASPDYRRIYETEAPLVSVCVSTYNRHQTLVERCIRSILSQTYQNVEAVVVGDGCTDETADAVSRIRDTRLRFENRLERESYPEHPWLRWMVAGTAASNRAVERARGDILMHLDDDDEFVPNAVESVVHHLKATGAEVVWFPYFIQTKEGGWMLWPAREFSMGHVANGCAAYLSWFKRIPFDPEAYRFLEGGDWNLFRKLRYVGAKLSRFPEPLFRHFSDVSLAGRALAPSSKGG